VDFTDNRLLYTPVVFNKLKRYMKDLTPQRPDSLIPVADALIRKVMPYKEYFKFFSNWIALTYENGKTTVMDGEAVFVHVIQNFFTPELAYWDTKESLEKLQKHVWEMEASLMGKKGPDVRAQDQFGVFKSIYEKTAPIVVIFMFSPDCEHCQKEAPEVQALYEKWKDKGVDFYGICVGTTDAEWKEFIKKNKFAFTNVFDPTYKAIYAKYFVDITPELYVLNQDRTIVAKNLHPNQLEAIFEREQRKMKH
jgi:peroxiredoxin